MTKAQEKQKAIEAYKNIVSGRVPGIKIYAPKFIKVGSITMQVA